MPTSQPVLGWPLPRRRSHLSALQNKPSDHKQRLTFQNHEILLGVYSVPIDLPKYRLANGRTQEAQEEYLATHPDQNQNFFTKDGESEHAQLVQHTLLQNLIKDADPETDLIKFFSHNKQDEPFILSDEGYVVNGNRRLCAFRDLYYDDNAKFSHFSHVEVMILPPCDFRDIDELEARLQIQPDIKQAYSWISKAIMLKKRQEQHNYTYDALANIYRMDQKEVGEALDLLSGVDEYLIDRGKDKQYHLVHKKEYAFKQLQKARKKIKKPEEKDLLINVCYDFIDGVDVGDRIYSFIPDIAEHLPSIATELTAKLNIQNTPPRKDSTYDIFGPIRNDLKELVHAVGDPQNHEAVVEVVREVIEGENAKKKDKKRADTALIEIGKANAALQTALICLAVESETTGIETQLNSIEQAVQKVRGWLATHAKNHS